MKINGGEDFVVWLNQDEEPSNTRWFREETLPDFIKVKLGIVMASKAAGKLNCLEMNATDFELSSLTQNLINSLASFGTEYDEIGWQYNKYYYCVVLTEEEFKSLL
jgi:hypothetical protein